MTMDTASQTNIIENLSNKLKANYIYPDVAEKIGAYLRQQQANGEYCDLTEGNLFALALTLNMQEVSSDEHLWVRWHPEPLPEDESLLRLNPEWQAQQRLAAERENFGFHKAERLPGNIGYLDIRYFHRSKLGMDTAAAALSFLSSAYALILDLRQCTGGYPDMVALVCSYLFGEEPVHLLNIYWRDEDTTQEYWTLPSVPGKRYPPNPVYVLTSKTTFSAGEATADILKKHQRATIIGEQTDGGAHPGTSYRLGEHFEVFIPIGRSFDPLTGEDWEGKGITPDIVVPQAHAYLSGYSMALKAVIARAEKKTSSQLLGMLEEARQALADLNATHHLCPRCGYQNKLYASKCKNCNHPFPDIP